MYNMLLERELEAQGRHGSGPLSWWRLLSAEEFAASADIVEAAVASIAAVSQLAPPDLIVALSTAMDEERAAVWNDLSVHYLNADMMQLGLCAEIAGSAAALSANLFDPFGLVMLLNLLSQPYTCMNPEARLATGATWLGQRGVLLNRTTLSQIEWHPPADFDAEEDTSWLGGDE